MRIFLDDEFDSTLARQGYVVVRLIDSDRAASLDAQCRKLLPSKLPEIPNVPFIYSGQAGLAWIERLVGALVDEALVPLLDDMRRYHPALIVKPAGERAVPPHVHPIFTLEQTAPILCCWCPLEDTDERNGAIQVLPGSHRLFPIMPMYGRRPYFAPFMDEIAERMETLRLRAGEALLFDETLIHASLPNPGSSHRLAIATHCIKSQFEPITLVRQGNGQYRVCATGEEFGYEEHVRKEEFDPGDRWPTLGYVEDVHAFVEADEFFDRLAKGERISLTYPLVPRREALPDRPRIHGGFARMFGALRAGLGVDA